MTTSQSNPTPPAEPEIVGGAKSLDLVAEFLERFVVFASKSQVYAVALWVLHSHAIEQADVSPYLAVTSAEKRSGKTLLLDVLELLVARPWRAVLPSEAVVYRKVAADRPTLLLDETDAIFGPKTAGNHEGLRALLNAGNRAGTTVPRVVGEGSKMAVKDFPIFCPKVIAGIGRLPDTVKDRAIPIRLQRRLRSELVERFRRREVQERASLLSLALANVAGLLEVADARPEIPSQLNDRAADGWEPLLAIADRLGGHWPARARHAAVALSAGADADEESLGIKLLDDVRSILDNVSDKHITTVQLIELLRAEEEWPWVEVDLHPRRLARLLKPYGVRPTKVRPPGAAPVNGYHRADLLAACERWLEPSPPDGTETPISGTPEQIADSEYENLNTKEANCSVIPDTGLLGGDKGEAEDGDSRPAWEQADDGGGDQGFPLGPAVVSIASAKDEIRRRRKLVPIGIDPLKGPWRILSTSGDYSHELHVIAGGVACSTCRSRRGRSECWATDRVLQSLGVKQATPDPEPGTWRAAFDEARRRRVEQPVTTPTGQQPLADHSQGET